jgi:hypothetical protein
LVVSRWSLAGKKKNLFNSKGGFVLPLTLIIVAALIIIGISCSMLNNYQAQALANVSDELLADYALDYAMARAEYLKDTTYKELNCNVYEKIPPELFGGQQIAYRIYAIGQRIQLTVDIGPGPAPRLTKEKTFNYSSGS